MVQNDILAATLSKLQNAMIAGKTTVLVKPVSKVVYQILDLFKEHGYITGYTIIKDGRGDHITVEGFEKINKCGVIKPRFNFTTAQAVREEQRYLPAQGFGIIIVSTSQGIMTLTHAREKHIGGKLLAYCY